MNKEENKQWLANFKKEFLREAPETRKIIEYGDGSCSFYDYEEVKANKEPAEITKTKPLPSGGVNIKSQNTFFITTSENGQRVNNAMLQQGRVLTQMNEALIFPEESDRKIKFYAHYDKDALLHGEYFYAASKDGERGHRSTFEHGKKIGVDEEYILDRSGHEQIVSKGYYMPAGNKNGKFVFELTKRALLDECEYKDNKRHGQERTVLREEYGCGITIECNWVDGVKVGAENRYYVSGRPYQMANNDSEGNFHGTVVTFYDEPFSPILSQEEFSHGQPVGEMTVYNKDGTLMSKDDIDKYGSRVRSPGFTNIIPRPPKPGFM